MEDEKPDGYIFGRPTKYKPEYCQEIVDFFSQNESSFFKDEVTIETKERIEMEGFPETEAKQVKIQTKWEYRAHPMPSFEKFAIKIGVSTKILWDWANKHGDFRYSMELCRDIMKSWLVDNGLLGLYNSNYARFIALNFTDLKGESENNNGLDNEETPYDSSAFKIKE